MRCPYCSAEDTRVINSRPSDEGAAIRRRRECVACSRRFTTYERAQFEALMVRKRSGRLEAFNPDKLLGKLRIACNKRPVSEKQLREFAYSFEDETGTPEIAIRLRPEALARWGLSPADLLDAAQTAFKGTEAGQVQEGNRVFNVSVVLAPGERRGMADVQALRIRTPEGAMVRLDQVADVYAGSGRYAVLRDPAGAAFAVFEPAPPAA